MESNNLPESKLRIYIAGPMRGHKNFNFKAFYKAEELLRNIGFKYIGNPADLDTRLYGEDIFKSKKGKTEDILKKDPSFSERKVLLSDMKWICTYATHMYMLEGWEYSLGAQAEHALAKALGLTIMYE